MTEDLSEVEILKKSFAEVGAINPVVVSSRTGEVIAGKSRRKTGLPWPTRTVYFKNSYEEALYAAHENLCRRILTEKEAQAIVKAIQDAHYETFNRYLTQTELGDRIGRSQQWFSAVGAWDEKWTHPSISGVKAPHEGFTKQVVGLGESEKSYGSLMPVEATKRLLDMRASDDAGPTNPLFKEVWEQVPRAAQSAFVLNRPDVEVLARAKEADPEIVQDGLAGEKYVLAVIDKFLHRPGDFVTIAIRLNQVWVKEVWAEIERQFG